MTQGVAATLKKLHGSYGTITSAGSLSTKAGAGATAESLHTALAAMAEQHFLRSAVDFYNSPAVPLLALPLICILPRSDNPDPIPLRKTGPCSLV